MRHTKALVFAGLAAAALGALLWFSILSAQFFTAALVVLLGGMAVFFAAFEGKKTSSEKLVLTAVLSALACAGRVVFTAIPSVQPASFIVIVTGMAFGAEMGFLVGALTAFASNLVLGQGPWTLFQMFTWGAMGLLSAVLSRPLKKSKLFAALYAIAWGFVFGWIMNAYFLLGMQDGSINIGLYIAACVTSAPLDLAHALTNALLLLSFGGATSRILGRAAVRYALASNKTSGKNAEPITINDKGEIK